MGQKAVIFEISPKFWTIIEKCSQLIEKQFGHCTHLDLQYGPVPRQSWDLSPKQPENGPIAFPGVKVGQKWVHQEIFEIAPKYWKFIGKFPQLIPIWHKGQLPTDPETWPQNTPKKWPKFSVRDVSRPWMGRNVWNICKKLKTHRKCPQSRRKCFKQISDHILQWSPPCQISDMPQKLPENGHALTRV